MKCHVCKEEIEIDCCIDDDVTDGQYWADLYLEYQDHPILKNVLCNTCAEIQFRLLKA